MSDVEYSGSCALEDVRSPAQTPSLGPTEFGGGTNRLAAHRTNLHGWDVTDSSALDLVDVEGP